MRSRLRNTQRYTTEVLIGRREIVEVEERKETEEGETKVFNVSYKSSFFQF